MIGDHFFQEQENNIANLNSNFYPNYFSMISPDLNLDKMTRTQFQNALTKGLCPRNMQTNGIKFLKKSLVELKINSDLRLYTNKIYRNSDGQCLIIFDNQGDHDDVTRKLKTKTPLKMINVERFRNQITGQVAFFNNSNVCVTNCNSNTNLDKSSSTRLEK